MAEPLLLFKDIDTLEVSLYHPHEMGLDDPEMGLESTDVMQDLPRIFTVRDSRRRAYKTDESGERITATGKKLGRPSKPGSLQMKRPAGLPKLTWMDKRQEWQDGSDARKAEIESWLTN